MPKRVPFSVLAFFAVSQLFAQSLSPERKLDVLTCNFKAGDESLMAVFSEAEASGSKTGDGEVMLNDDQRIGDICLRDVKLAAAFGVVGISGRICGTDPTPFIKHVRKTELGAFERSISGVPGVLAAFETKDRNLVISRGSIVAPDPGSATVSYLCSVKLGDHR